jgi:ABC-2 type transport system ATP-binding protein
MATAVEVSGLTRHYDGLAAVDGIDFLVEEGEIFGFLGPNGAGKTTTIRMLTGLSKPSAGSARVLGYDIASEIVKAKRPSVSCQSSPTCMMSLAAWKILYSWGSFTASLVASAGPRPRNS